MLSFEPGETAGISVVGVQGVGVCEVGKESEESKAAEMWKSPCHCVLSKG